MERSPLEADVNKWVASAFGVLLALVGAPFLVVGGFAVYRFLSGTPDATIVFLGIASMLLGAFCVQTGIRMVFGIRRNEGGLFPPFVLRTAGVFFLLAPVILLFARDGFDWRSVTLLLEIGFYLVVAGTCFALANRREHPPLGVGMADDDD